jgi:hypothetical protein
MEQKPLTLLVIGIVVGALVGFGGGFAVYNSQIVDLKGSLTDVQLQYVTLSGQYQVLSTQKDALQNDYTRLSAQNKSLGASYNQLQSTYGQLQSNYGQLQTNYGNLKGFLGVLTNDVVSLNQTFYQDGFLPKAFTRTLSSVEIGKVTSLTSSIDKTEPIPLSAYSKIYLYVSSFVTYANQVNYPYLQLGYSTINGTKYVSGFLVNYHEVYYRTPSETIQYHEGNIVDQAVLQYAMMINYQQNIKKISQDMYIGVMDFQDGTHASAVFVPALNNQITIFDTAGHYMTHDLNEVSSKIAASELGTYYNYYNSQGKTIGKFTLYKINGLDGSVSKTVQGSLSNMIAFFSS